MELNDRDKIDMYNMMVGIRKMILKRKKHIKKYYKYRKIHGEVLDSMLNYIYKGKYNYMDKYESILDDLRSETRIQTMLMMKLLLQSYFVMIIIQILII